MLKWNVQYPLVLFLLVLSGCRVGNYSSPTPTPSPSGTYKSAELFQTQPAQLQAVAFFSDGSGGTTHLSNTSVDVSAVPVSVLQIFSNPVYFAIPNDTTKPPLFVGQNQSSYLNSGFDKKGNISYTSNSAITTLWNNPNCQTQVQITQTGSLDRTTPGTATLSDGSKAKVAGNLKLSLTYLRVISGDCAADLQALATCYTTGAGCQTGELNASEALFDLYTKQSGVLDPTNTSQVGRIIGLAYIVTFQ